MKLHLPLALSRVLFASFATLALTQISSGTTPGSYPNGSIIYTDGLEIGAMDLTLDGYESVWFKDSPRGASFNSGTCALNENGAVTVSGNSAATSVADFPAVVEAYGGGIYNAEEAAFTLSGNETVTFGGNSASALSVPTSGYYTLEHLALGGAIYNADDATFTLSGNGEVAFSGNSATASAADSEFPYVDTHSYGSAIYNSGFFTLSGNGDVTFSGNASAVTASSVSVEYDFSTSFFSDALGAAIYNADDETFLLSDNGNVTFSGNSVISASDLSLLACWDPDDYRAGDSHSYGGAIYNGLDSTFELSGNGDVTFSDNTAASSSTDNDDMCWDWYSESEDIPTSSSRGGAIYNADAATFTLSDNENVTFSGNSCSSTHSGEALAHDLALGGAIYNADDATFTLSGNGDVTFSDNSATATTDFVECGAEGGAIYNANGTFELSGNNSVTFSGNSCSSTSSSVDFDYIWTYSYGGAICNNDWYATFTLSGNGDVTFSGNTVSASGSGDEDYINIAGGAILNMGTFTLSDNGNVLFEKNAEILNGSYRLRSICSYFSLNLSATTGKRILFKDSVYAEGEVNLNQDGAGDIIFSGATTEADLREMKGGVDGTAEEILNSRTSVLAGDTVLYGGRLMVEDGAILNVKNLTVAEGAGVVVKDGTLALNNGNATITTAAGAEKAVLTGTSLDGSSLAGADAEHRGTVAGAQIDIAKGIEFSLQHLVLAATTRISDDPATANLDDVTAELMMGVNTSKVADGVLPAGAVLVQNGNTAQTLSPEAAVTVVQLEATTFDSVTLTGSSLVLELRGLEAELYNGADYVALSFTGGKSYATFGDGLSVLLSADGEHYAQGHYLQGADHTTLYFVGRDAGLTPEQTPEPATATLSLLALAALVARRKRK